MYEKESWEFFQGAQLSKEAAATLTSACHVIIGAAADNGAIWNLQNSDKIFQGTIYCDKLESEEDVVDL